MTPPGARPSDQSSFRAPLLLFWTGLLVRVAYITLAHTYRFSPFEDHFTFGYEMARVARALVTGYGYADPFSGHTGPTAWVPPLYPLLIAAVFKVAGIYTPLSAWILLTLNSVFSAATSLCVYEIAARCYNRRVAVWSAWIWALYPAAMQYATRWVWETSLSTFLFAAVLVLALRMRAIGEAIRRPTRSPPAAGSSSDSSGRSSLSPTQRCFSSFRSAASGSSSAPPPRRVPHPFALSRKVGSNNLSPRPRRLAGLLFIA